MNIQLNGRVYVVRTEAEIYIFALMMRVGAALTRFEIGGTR